MGIFEDGRSRVHTRDGTDLSTLLMDGVRVFDKYNDEVDRPWIDRFTKTVSDGSIQVRPDHDMSWEELGEMESLSTDSLGGWTEEYFGSTEYGKALSWNRGYVQKKGREELNREFTALVEAYDDMERNDVHQMIMNGAHDGRSGDQLWFDPGERGNYEFDRTHNHTFGSTDELFYDDAYGTDSTAGTAHTPTEHIRRGNAHLRHHDKSPAVVLCSSLFKEQFIDEVSWEANYQFPEYTGLRTQSIENSDARVDGVSLLETPWINDHTSPDGTYELHFVADDNPIAFWPDAEPQLVANEKGAPLTGPWQLFDAHGYARYGMFNEDPLSFVEVTADNVA